MGGRVAGKAPIDWPGAERFYVQGEAKPGGGREFPSYAAVATRFGASIGAVTLHGREDDWPGKREDFVRSLQERIAKECTENGVQAVLAAASQGGRLTSKLAAIALYLLGDDPPPTGVRDPKWTGPDAATLDRVVKLARAFKDVATGTRYLTGAPPPGTPPAGAGGGPGGLPPFSEADRQAALDAIHARNQDPAGPDGAPAAAGDE